MDVPIFITARDRLTCLRELVQWLVNAGHQNITILDNDSSYPPLLEWYATECPAPVVSLGENLGCRALWKAELVPRDERYVVTDPDIIPIEQCPGDLIARLSLQLDRYPGVPKAGPGLYLEDLPEGTTCPIEWERSLHSQEVEPGVYRSLIDTTFALYRAGHPFRGDAFRLGFPYQARHTSWYVTDFDAENSYYLAHARDDADGSSWKQQVGDVSAD